MKAKKTPAGIDPGFGYNPGKAWQEPSTLLPLSDKYQAFLAARGQKVPPPFLPTPVNPLH